MTEAKEITFRQDTAHRKKWFRGLSFAHPAKMHLSLQIYLIEQFTKPGDTILDPMFGSGSLLVACAIGRNVIGIELEQKFIDMAKANWNKIKSLGPILGYKFGDAKIACGDSRDLDVLTPNIDLLNVLDDSNKVAILYLLIGNMSNEKSLILEVFVPFEFTKFIPVPVFPIDLNNMIAFNNEVCDISTDSDLAVECYSALGKIFSNDRFLATLVIPKHTTSGTNSNPHFLSPFRRIKGLPTSGALLNSASIFSGDGTSSGATFTATIDNGNTKFKWLPANYADKFASILNPNSTTFDRTEFSLTLLCFGVPDRKVLSTYFTNFRNSLALIMTGTRTESGIVFEARWCNLKYLSALLAGTGDILTNSILIDSSFADKTTLSGAKFASTSSKNRRCNIKGSITNATNTGKFSHTNIIRGDAQKSKQNKKIICGDARQLPEVLADVICTSPPFSEAKFDCKHGIKGKLSPNLKGRKVWEEKFDGNPTNPSNIGNLKYGEIDKVIQVNCIVSSPPYEGSISGKELPDSEKLIERKSGKGKWGKHLRLGKSQLTKYADCICCSPPYEKAEFNYKHGMKETTKNFKGRKVWEQHFQQQVSQENIGNLKGDSYLASMLLVYRGCHRVLRDGGLLCLVTKNFIRNKKIVRLDLDTIKLCEQAGFRLKERLARKLTQQSFWRIIYYKKYPDAPRIDVEDVLVFEKMGLIE